MDLLSKKISKSGNKTELTVSGRNEEDCFRIF
jgi:hypothetical protein